MKSLARPVLAHRLVLTTDAELSDVAPEEIVDEIVAAVDPPGSGENLTAEAVGDGGADGDGEN